ncbi:hypothetical protein Tco_0864290 [Tanacetum coccineum]
MLVLTDSVIRRLAPPQSYHKRGAYSHVIFDGYLQNIAVLFYSEPGVPVDYVLGPKEPEQASLLPNYIPEPNYIPIEDQPLPVDASPTALSPGYVAEFNPEEDLEKDPEEDPTDYPTDDDDEEEEEHLASVDSFVIPAVDPVPSAEDTEAFEADEAAGIRWRVASPTTHHSSKTPSLPLLLPPTTHRDDLTKEDMPLQKRARFTAPTCRFEVGESSSAALLSERIVIRTDCFFIWSVSCYCPKAWASLKLREGALPRRPDYSLWGRGMSMYYRGRGLEMRTD